MSLNKIERELLIEARSLIETRRCSYICFALALARDSLLREATTSERRIALGHGHDRLVGYVSRKLCGQAYLEGWQRKQGLKYRSREQCRLDRIAWINWMLSGK